MPKLTQNSNRFLQKIERYFGSFIFKINFCSHQKLSALNKFIKNCVYGAIRRERLRFNKNVATRLEMLKQILKNY